MLLVLVSFMGTASAQTADEDFAQRCSQPGVVRCVGFDTLESVTGRTDYAGDPAPFGLLDDGPVAPAVDAGQRASGGGSLMFTIPSMSGSSFGSYFLNFSDDFSVQFGVGDDFYVQWRQRFSRELLETTYYSNFAAGEEQGGWKQVIVGEGDRPGTNIYSCTDLEIVVNDGGQLGFPQIYHSCGAKDGQYEGLQEPFGSYDFLLQNAIRDPGCLYTDSTVPPCFGYVADEWMTFQMRVHIGTPYDNDRVYAHDSIIQLWVAREGQPSELVIDYSPMDPECQAEQTSQPRCQTGYDLFNDDPATRRYGQIWLLPYMTAKDPAQPHPTAYTWYDELIVSRNPIADPLGEPPISVDAGTRPDGGATSMPGTDGGSSRRDGGGTTTTPPPGEEEGCACRATGAPSSWWMLLPLAWLWRRR